MKRWLVWVLILLGLSQLGQGFYIEAKAWLAQQLLERAWERARVGEARPLPWPWADTWPVARLRVDRLGIRQVVLAGASGRTLAFGPGHLFASAPPGSAGNSAISGHRDTHFRFLRDQRAGDRIELERRDGARVRYAVYRRGVVHDTDSAPLRRQGAQLTLITCYPFDALSPGGSDRFVVEARRIAL
ncbi:MAG: class GN sortase [gamma proteobacterium symbiont of Phacoides pectinatus]